MKDDDRIVGIITARGGSKSIPRKNIVDLAGKPLIAWTIEAALNSKLLGSVIVSTDDSEIAKIAQKYGAEVPFIRPADLARDDSPHLDVVLHAVNWLADNRKLVPEYVMTLQPTSPLRSTFDIDAAIEITKTKTISAVVSVCEARPHPLLSKRIREDGTLADFVHSHLQYLRRQDLLPAYVLNGAIYLNRTDSIFKYRTLLPQDTYAYIMPTERSLDIDAPWDIYLADLILRDRFGAKAN